MMRRFSPTTAHSIRGQTTITPLPARLCRYPICSATRARIFVNAPGRYSWNRSKSAVSRTFLGDYIFYSYTSQPSSSRGVLAYANVSKTLDFMRGAIGVNTNYNRNENNMWSQGLATNYINDSFSRSSCQRQHIVVCQLEFSLYMEKGVPENIGNAETDPPTILSIPAV